MKTILFVLWFFLPAGLANVAPVLAAKFPGLRDLSYPLDCYAKFRGKRIFGDHKTIRGLLSGIIVGIATVYIQVYFYKNNDFIRSIIPLDYGTLDPFLLGLLASTGSLLGDAVKSFFKRQMNIASGKTWFPFDQIDYIIGGVLFTSFYIHLTLQEYIVLFIVWFLLHPLTTFFGWLLKLKDSPI